MDVSGKNSFPIPFNSNWMWEAYKANSSVRVTEFYPCLLTMNLSLGKFLNRRYQILIPHLNNLYLLYIYIKYKPSFKVDCDNDYIISCIFVLILNQLIFKLLERAKSNEKGVIVRLNSCPTIYGIVRMMKFEKYCKIYRFFNINFKKYSHKCPNRHRCASLYSYLRRQEKYSILHLTV